MRLHIVAPDIRKGDAVGNHCLYLANALPVFGIDTLLYAKQFSVSGSNQVHNLESLLHDTPVDSDDALLLSYSTFQPQLTTLLEIPCRKMVYFHGITPVDLLIDQDPAAAYWSSKALLQLPMLAACDAIIGNSNWNLSELKKHLPPNVDDRKFSVVPPVTPDMPLYYRRHHQTPVVGAELQLLTVGRIAPHKKLEDVLAMTAEANRRGHPTRLVVVGNATSLDYMSFLGKEVIRLGLGKRVEFKGHISDEELSACLDRAQLLVSASRHEGFCIPVLEAMYTGLPVVIKRGTGASEIADGVCLEFDTPDQGVDAIVHLASDQAALEQMARLGRKRAEELLREADVSRLTAILQRL